MALIDSIFEPSRLDTYTRNEDAYIGYKIAIRLLQDAKTNGLCNFRYDDPDIPFEVHGIFIEWNYDDGGLCEITGKELSTILRNVASVVISKDDPTWELSATIYTEA